MFYLGGGIDRKQREMLSKKFGIEVWRTFNIKVLIRTEIIIGKSSTLSLGGTPGEECRCKRYRIEPRTRHQRMLMFRIKEKKGGLKKAIKVE